MLFWNMVRDSAIDTGTSRRRFLTNAAKAVAGVTFAGWASAIPGSAGVAAPGDGEFTVVDTHTHFYDPTRSQGVPWPPRGEKQLYRRVLPKDYLGLPIPRRVSGTVVVEASPWVDDNQWVLDLAAKEPFIVGVVGNLPVGSKQFAGHLKRFTGNKLFRGIRIRDRKLDGTLEDPAFVSDLKLLADHGLSLDLVGGSEIPPYAVELAKKIPALRVIVDHLAGVVVDGRQPSADWVRGMKGLVPHTNIYCKLSGLVEGTGKRDGSAPHDVEYYRPVLDCMREMFGVKRLIYASNWPVSELYAPLATVQGIIGDYFRSCGRRAEEQVCALSGRAAYHWIER
jgi:predicted TIM-barrel fold metal-dependent hydrolase